MTKKPRFCWRTLACLPYIMPLHEPWMYAQTACQLHLFLQTYLTYPFLGALGRLPNWLMLAHFFICSLGAVRRKERTHFFWFLVVTSMLLEILLQVVGVVDRWLRSGLYWGKIGMHFWTVIAFGHLFTVLECTRCAVSGMYAHIPFVSAAAYIQVPLIDQDLQIDLFRWPKCHLFSGKIFRRTSTFCELLRILRLILRFHLIAYPFHFPLPFPERLVEFIWLLWTLKRKIKGKYFC